MITDKKQHNGKFIGTLLRWLALSLLFVGTHALAQSAGTVTYVYTDPQGTPLAEADASGNITATFEYTPYGTYAPQGTSAPGAAPKGPGYTGHVNDPETNLVYMQSRYYDPATGLFLSVDPVPVAAGNTNGFAKYSYGDDNPVAYVDPDGRASKIAYLIELTATGIRRLSALTKEQAVIARMQERNVLVTRRQLAHQIESAAHDPSGQLKHGGHLLDDGSTGLPHYQTEGKRGHTFWGGIAGFSSSASDDLDKVAGLLKWIPDFIPAPTAPDTIPPWEDPAKLVKHTDAYGMVYYDDNNPGMLSMFGTLMFKKTSSNQPNMKNNPPPPPPPPPRSANQ